MTNSNFVEGVNIIARHMPEDQKDKFDFHAEHDQFWFGADDWVSNEEDRKKLDDLGWFIDENRWCIWT